MRIQHYLFTRLWGTEWMNWDAKFVDYLWAVHVALQSRRKGDEEI